MRERRRRRTGARPRRRRSHPLADHRHRARRRWLQWPRRDRGVRLDEVINIARVALDVTGHAVFTETRRVNSHNVSGRCVRWVRAEGAPPTGPRGVWADSQKSDAERVVSLFCLFVFTYVGN